MRVAREPFLWVMLVLSVIVASIPDGSRAQAAPQPETMGGEELLADSIAYHDPEDRWFRSAWRLEIAGTRPLAGATHTGIVVDHVGGTFRLERERDGHMIEATVSGDECRVLLDGSSELTAERVDEYGLDCPRMRTTRDYHVYLYGLPMKLRDEGARIDGEARRESFQGREVWSLRVTYDPDVGTDTWYFYFDPDSRALVGYRFFHDEAANDGEYVVLDREVSGGGVRLPKVRTWYTNAEDRLLGTDTVRSVERVGPGR